MVLTVVVHDYSHLLLIEVLITVAEYLISSRCITFVYADEAYIYIH